MEARHAAEEGVRAAFASLGVEEKEKPDHLSEQQAQLRRGLRAKQRQLGGDFDVLVWDAAYEQWHRLLFARFLAENELLMHPEYDVPVTLAECEELAEEMEEPDGWSVAARFASEILPGLFRLEDPCVQLRLAPEHMAALEKIVEGLAREVFLADDSLGWVYQYWQAERKDEVNASGDKIGGADLGPVTQLFTENYMVRFLLENSLGAWWAARHPESPLVEDFDYLRFDEDGNPAAGEFESWPDRAAEVTVMDPCCGSGHFLVEAFGMLWRMRAEEEGLDKVEAQDAVLRDNIFGLELDPRCVQIAMFAVALTAWKQGDGWRGLPTPNIACSGIPVKASLDDWKGLAEGDNRLERGLERLHALFKNADTLGSLIDPRRVAEGANRSGGQRSFEDIEYGQIVPLLTDATKKEAQDPATRVLGADAISVARAAELLARNFTLIATNVPYLARGRQSEVLQQFVAFDFSDSDGDLAVSFLERARRWTNSGGSIAQVLPHNWLFLVSYRSFRERMLTVLDWQILATLGPGAFDQISGEVVKAALLIASSSQPTQNLTAIDASRAGDPAGKAEVLKESIATLDQFAQRDRNPDSRVVIGELPDAPILEKFAQSLQGISPADTPRYSRQFWEVNIGDPWVQWQGPSAKTIPYGGRSRVLRWDQSLFDAVDDGHAYIRGEDAWGHWGVAVRQVGSLPATIYTGDRFDTSCAVIVPDDPDLVTAIWAFAESDEFSEIVRLLDRKLNVTNATFGKVPFDIDKWKSVAEERYPQGLPEPNSNDPSQWLFRGRPESSTEPLQVAVARILGYRWPEQAPAGDLDDMENDDSIACLPAVAGEIPVADRLKALLVRAHGDEWSPKLLRHMLEEAGSKQSNLSDWLRDDFFKHHCSVFSNRPFIWHIWDGRKDGFAAMVNYHKLDRTNLEKLTYTYLGDWIERQRADAAQEVPGADSRLAAAKELKEDLELILEGEPPYDIYVRWKDLHEQPIGWDPDLDDGVRLNIRPFVKADVLRSKFSIHWRKDRGKDPDGSERHNDLHYTIAEKERAREKAQV